MDYKCNNCGHEASAPGTCEKCGTGEMMKKEGGTEGNTPSEPSSPQE